MDKIGFLYFGRLDKEKGFDSICDAIEHFGDNGKKEINFQIYVFGQGKFRDRILNLSEKYEDVHYFGFQPLIQIGRYVNNCHFTIMPSEFLETFGLSALNSFSFGLPVIGYKKGGLDKFVFDDFDLNKYSGNTKDKIIKMLDSLIKKQENNDLSINKQKIIDISDEYSIENREKRVQNLFGKNKNVLFVSDFLDKVGGIETYIYNSIDIFSKIGYKVSVFGTKFGKFKVMKYLGVMFFSLFNLVAWIGLKLKIKNTKPDIIWYHSIHRFFGWMTLKVNKNIKKYLMIHDFGLIYPFPSELTNVNMLKYPLNFRNFFAMAKSKNIFVRFALFFKFLNLFFLKKTIKNNIDTILVPSDYMVDIVSKSFEIGKKKIVVLEHFSQF